MVSIDFLLNNMEIFEGLTLIANAAADIDS
jgi:hypothetical protein